VEDGRHSGGNVEAAWLPGLRAAALRVGRILLFFRANATALAHGRYGRGDRDAHGLGNPDEFTALGDLLFFAASDSITAASATFRRDRSAPGA
jgi:hypothetical protein